MKNVDDLIEDARDLADRGLTRGEIADELNVSRETARWLVDRQPDDTDDIDPGTDLDDVHVDWQAIGRDATRLQYAGAAMADLLTKHGEDIDLVVGIEKAGVPLATVVATELAADIATYVPRKHQWEDGDIEELQGTFSRNFADIRARDCYVVDDTITSGTTMGETLEAVRAEGGDPVAGVVLADKQGLDRLDGVPIYSLLQVIRVE